MYKYSLVKHVLKLFSELTGNKLHFRYKTDNLPGSKSEFIVTEEQILKDNFGTDAPLPPNVDDCCGEGCQNCVWLEYVIQLKYFTNNDRKKIKEAIDSIPNMDVKMFVKFEMKFDDNL